MNGRPDRWTDGMPYPRDRRLDAGGPESPEEGRPELREVDALLGRYARRQPVPAGLVDRIYEASVGQLPSRRPRREPVLRFRPALVGSMWGRLAMAASIVIAFVVGARLASETEPRAPHRTEVERVWLDYEVAGDLDLYRRFREQEESRYGAVERLLATRDVRYRDLTGDLANLAANLEM